MTKTEIDPKQHDEKLAALYHELAKANQQMAFNDSGLLSLANAHYYYQGRKRVTDMTVEEALEIVEAEVAKLQAHRATHSGESLWVGYTGMIAPYDQDRAERVLTERPEREEAIVRIENEIANAELAYTGWSRFFLVTSSAGHVHRSMHCSSCRFTTTYGWLPQLSGQDEGEAVNELGPNLCSVCFPSAPVEHQGGKITAAQAAKKAFRS